MTRVQIALTAALLASQPFLVPGGDPQAQPAAGQPHKAVLVTGASSGIGRKMTEVLAARGLFVYAGARKAEDLESLNAIPNVQGIRLDVTNTEDIAAAVTTVQQAGRGLWGVINNAGVSMIGPLIELSDADVNFVFDVNVLGPHRITRAFSELLIASKGRVITTGSISGILAEPLGGAYSMSKHAIEAYTDALAAEAYLFPSDAGLCCIAVSVNKSRFDWLRESLTDRFQERIRDHAGFADRFATATVEGRVLGSGPEPNFMRIPAGPGWALVGDAGLHQDPWTGRGMDMASVHARFLAESIDTWLKGTTPELGVMAAYHRRRNEHAIEAFRETVTFGRDLRAMAAALESSGGASA